MNALVMQKTINRKSDLRKAYPNITEDLFKNTINSIIAKVRNLDLEKAKPKQLLYPKEVSLFREEIDPVYKG